MEQADGRLLLSLAYLAPVQYFSKMAGRGEVWIETREHFLKQSYRNRCIILSANGPQSLSIPVREGPNSKKEIRDTEVSYDHPWQKLHWKAIVSAYNNAPFFLHYADAIRPFYQQQKWKYLLDYNLEIQESILVELGIHPAIHLTGEFLQPSPPPENWIDLRYVIHPKPGRQQPDAQFIPVEYMQVFQEKFGFTPNLSIIDLLFNEGPAAAKILLSSKLE